MSGPMMGDEPREPKGWYSRGYLPHFDVPGLTQSINFRLFESLPKSVIEGFQTELKYLKTEEAKREMSRKIDKFLDLGRGPTFLAKPENAEIVQKILLNADGEYYRLHAWCVMPNHVHVLFTPTGNVSLGEIVKGWKGVTNRLIRRNEPNLKRVWADEFFDRYIRNERHYWNEVAYIENNPVKAGLCPNSSDWSWCSASVKSIE